MNDDILAKNLKGLYELIINSNFNKLKKLTPYLHTVIHHLPVFFENENYKNIDIFNLQGKLIIIILLK